MPRARNIKPSFFKNEDLALCEHGARLVFIGLWTVADREGRLEDRPMRIKAELFPYENCDIEKWLSQLADKGFIFRYVDSGRKFIQVLNFKKHQSPHMKESDSTIPAPDEHQISTMLAHLNPECGMRNPERGILNSDSSRTGHDSCENGTAKPSRKKFVKPTLEEVESYCDERDNAVPAQQFIDHYESCGWVVGKGKPMKDWKAAIRSVWEPNHPKPVSRVLEPKDFHKYNPVTGVE